MFHFSAQDQKQYRCAQLDNAFDNLWAARNPGKTDQQKCERKIALAGGASKRKWTGGNNDDYPGCDEGCTCCAEDGWIVKEADRVIQNAKDRLSQNKRKYRCAKLDTFVEKLWARRNPEKTDQEQCERELRAAKGASKRTWTGGNNEDYTGCEEGCKCCAEDGWIVDEAERIIENIKDRLNQDDPALPPPY